MASAPREPSNSDTKERYIKNILDAVKDTGAGRAPAHGSEAGAADRAVELAAFVRTHTQSAEVPHCGALRLHTAVSFTATWEAAEAAGMSAAPPYWAIPWVGGQALARYLLAHPERVVGRRVLDVGTGGGICAIAAALAGACRVQARDVDPMALAALTANAALNGVQIEPKAGDPPDAEDGDWEVILAADLWYERFLAGRMTAWLLEQARGGRLVLLGDRGRAYFPRRGVEALEWFQVNDIADTEAQATLASAAWEMRAGGRD